ncbi:MAG: sulfite exporter TauE/SafE family protein [Campylobacterales bacterium]
MEAINLFSIITIAFLGSFGHCIGMCGGIVIAYSSIKVSKEWSRYKQSMAHILYSLGRVSTYAIIGALFGFLGSAFAFDNVSNGILLIIASVVMILAGVSLLGKIKFLTFIEHSVSKTGWYQRSFKKLLHSNSLGSFYALGALNGLLPCGFVYFFAIAAAGSASPLWGAVIMAVFGLSTIPALFGLGFFVGVASQGSFRNLMIKLAAVAVIVYGLITLYDGVAFLTDPSKSILSCHE